MAQKILITGATGFIGSHLVPFLRNWHYLASGVTLQLTEIESVENAVKSDVWDVVIHLAGMSHVLTCQKDPKRAFQVNCVGTVNLYQIVQKHLPQAHFIFASSAMIYAAPQGSEIQKGVIFDEARKIEPQNIYAMTKWGAEKELTVAHSNNPTPLTILRLFNHTHKSQSPTFFLPYLYSILSKIPKNQKTSVPTGNLDLERDLGALVDLLEAFHAILKTPLTREIRILNICSGHQKNLRTLANELAHALSVRARFIVDASRVRKEEPRSICGSHDKITLLTGWKPQFKTENELIRSFLRA